MAFRRLWVALLAGASIPALPVPAAAQTRLQDLEALQRLAVAQAEVATRDVAGKVVIGAARIDPNLRLPACPAPEAFVPRGSRLWGRSLIGVRCRTPHDWSVMVQVTVQVFGPAVYAARPLPAGRPIGAADLQVREADLTQLPAGVMSDPAQVAGRLPKLALSAGLPLRADMLRGARVIASGQAVTVVYRADGYAVRAEGKAVGNAEVGQTVQVRMPSGRVITGVASGPGEVEVH